MRCRTLHGVVLAAVTAAVLLLLSCLAAPAKAAAQAAPQGRVPAPRVALLFATRGPMPLEGIWRSFLGSVRDDPAPLVTAQEFAALMGEPELPSVRGRLQLAGKTTASLRLQQKGACLSTEGLRVRSVSFNRRPRLLPCRARGPTTTHSFCQPG
jgi:hypothetical protein